MTKKEFVKWIKPYIEDEAFCFDGYQLEPGKVYRATGRRYKDPMANYKTRQFLGGNIEYGVRLVLKILQYADYFKYSPATGLYRQDAIVMKWYDAKTGDRYYLKVFLIADPANGDPLPIVVLHD